LSVTPESANFLHFLSNCKGLLFDGQSDEMFQVLCLGISVAHLPIPNRTARNAQEFGQSRLRQPNRRTQGKHKLPKYKVLLRVWEPVHLRALIIASSLHRFIASLPCGLQDAK
jgi:hypothetical protein